MTLNTAKIVADIELNGYADVRIKNGSFSIEPRPEYCNRGSYLVKIFPDINQVCLFIDSADLFPRYYFLLNNMISELEAWIEKNGQSI